MYYPQDFDAHPSFIQPTALQPGATVAYKLDTRIRDVWVLTVALNSCPTLGRSYKKPHHLQLQTLRTIYDFEEDDNRIITYPANETYQLDIDFNKNFDCYISGSTSTLAIPSTASPIPIDVLVSA